MEKNLDAYIRRLIELDSKAVAFKGERDAELSQLEIRSRNELRRIGSVLEKSAELAKHRYEEQMGEARQQAMVIEEAAGLNISELKAAFSSFREDAAKAVWKQLLEIER